MAYKKQVFENLNNKRVSVTVVGLLTTDDIDSMRENLQNQIDAHNEKHGTELKLVEKEKMFEIAGTNGQYVLKPKLKKYREGVISFKSKEYSFLEDGAEHESWGAKSRIIPHDDGLGFNLPVGTNKVIDDGDLGGHLSYRLI